MASLSVIIPTAGRNTLVHVLASITGQPLHPDDEVVVIGDTADGPLPQIKSLVEAQGTQFRYMAYNAGQHAWGHPQINVGMAQAKGDYLVFNDDDDLFSPGAFAAIRHALARHVRPVPLMCRFQSYQHGILWSTPGLVRCGYVGGHCIIAPNDATRLGRWADRYEGDFDFIASTLSYYDNVADWNPAIIAIARPPFVWRPARNAQDLEALRQMRNAGRDWLRDTAAISEQQQQRWWIGRQRGHWQIYLLSDLDGQDLGAGVLSLREDGRWWITVLVAPEHRRRGIGTTIYRWLAYAALADVWAEVRSDNIASLKAAERAGYRLESTNSQHAIFVASQLHMRQS